MEENFYIVCEGTGNSEKDLHFERVFDVKKVETFLNRNISIIKNNLIYNYSNDILLITNDITFWSTYRNVLNFDEILCFYNNDNYNKENVILNFKNHFYKKFDLDVLEYLEKLRDGKLVSATKRFTTEDVLVEDGFEKNGYSAEIFDKWHLNTYFNYNALNFDIDFINITNTNHNIKSFYEFYRIDFLNDSKKVKGKHLKYFNSENKLRVFIPPFLILLLKKNKDFTFYIENYEISNTLNTNIFYLEIKVNFHYNDEFTFKFNEIKKFINAKYLGFNSIDNNSLSFTNKTDRYLKAEFNEMEFIINSELCKKLEKNPNIDLKVEFLTNDKNSILLTEEIIF